MELSPSKIARLWEGIHSASRARLAAYTYQVRLFSDSFGTRCTNNSKNKLQKLVFMCPRVIFDIYVYILITSSAGIFQPKLCIGFLVSRA